MKYKKNKSMKLELCSIKNFVTFGNYDLLNFFENCVTGERESQKSELLINYFKTGTVFSKILLDLMEELSDYSETSVVTSMIKGTGLASIFKAKYVNFELICCLADLP